MRCYTNLAGESGDAAYTSTQNIGFVFDNSMESQGPSDFAFFCYRLTKVNIEWQTSQGH